MKETSIGAIHLELFNKGKGTYRFIEVLSTYLIVITGIGVICVVGVWSPQLLNIIVFFRLSSHICMTARNLVEIVSCKVPLISARVCFISWTITSSRFQHGIGWTALTALKALLITVFGS